MDPLSVTASIIAILQLTVKVSEGLKDLTDASTDRIQFETDIRYLSNLLVALLSRIDESSDDPWHVRARELGAKGGLIYQYRVALVLLRDKISAGHGIKKIGKALLWKYIKDDAERILLGMERLKSFVQMALGMDHFELSRAIESRVSSLQEDNNIIGEGVGAIQHDIDRQRHHLIMNWLSSADFPAQQADFLALVQADTGLWFLNSPEFNEWLQGPSKTLFCHGIPGAGKTMIAAIAVDYLHNNMESPDVGVAYLYCSYKRQADQNAPDLLAAILKQLVQDRPSIAQPLSSLYNSHKVRGTRLSLSETLRTLKPVLTHFSKVYVVIDALDECTDQDGTRSQLLKFCRDFGEQTDLRLMVTSRDIPDIADEFKRIPQLEVRASNADVRQYVGGKVKQLAKCVQRDGDLQELVQNKIVEAVDGMFLLAYLHLKSLVGKRTKANIISTLDNLSKGPEALNDAYSEAIVRIDSQPEDDRISAKNVLAWILYAQRPLTTTELCHALATRTTDKELDLDNIPDIKDLVSVCAGLVTIDEESQIVRLVHYTTQNYLVSIQEKWIHDIQYHIASTCLTYLCFNTFTTGSCTSDVEFESRLEQHEFLDYCAQYWGQHVAAVQERICGPAMVLLQNTELIASATQAHTIALKKSKWDRYSQDIPKNVTGLHLAVSFGLSYLCEQLLPSDQGEKLTLADARDSDGLTPLMWAARNGHEDAVMLLLRIAEVNPNARDNEGRTPLIWAALNGHENTVKQLLLSTNRVYPNVGDDGGWTPLVWAARNGHKDTVEQLLLSTNNADPNMKDKDGWTPLIYAAESGQNDIVDLLLGLNKVGVSDYSAALFTATLEGQEDTVQLLLSTDKFDPNARDDTGQTPLIWEVQMEDEGAIQLLLSTNRVDPNTKDNNGFTPLIWAVQKGSKDMVEVLLSTDRVDPNAKDKNGFTPLIWAVHIGSENMVEVLLSTDRVDPNAKDKNGFTPLFLAVYQGFEGIVKLLLSTDRVDPNAKEKNGWTPLFLAVYQGFEGIVKLLLSTNKANLDEEDNGIPMLLKLAAAEGHEDIAELLKEKCSLRKA